MVLPPRLASRPAPLLAALGAALCCLALAAPWAIAAPQPAGAGRWGPEGAITGLWEAIDEGSGRPLSWICLRERDGALVGQVVRVLLSSRGPHPRCVKCSGALHDAPIEGMEVLWGLRPTGQAGHWAGGSVLDPGRGSTYRAALSRREDGQIELRGYLGISLFGRTQLWRRAVGEEARRAAQAQCADAEPAGRPGQQG